MTIPKVLHVYWSGNLSWLRYLTVVSFKKFNPTWKVKLWIPIVSAHHKTWGTGEQKGYNGFDYTQQLKNIVDEVVSFDMHDIDMSNDLPEVHKSDIVRNYILSEEGGIYSDMDILYFKPIPDSILEKDFVCHVGVDYSIGFLGAQTNSKFYSWLLTKQKALTGAEYQAYGNGFLHRFKLSRFQEQFGVNNISMNLVYYLDCNKIPIIFTENVTFPKESIGLHWYGGHELASEWERLLTPHNYTYDNILCETIDKVMT